MTNHRWAHIHMFPQEIIDLNEELIHHPELQLLLAKHHASQIEMKFAEISAYCGIILDGEYCEEDMIPLAVTLKKRLFEKRSGILIINSVSSNSGENNGKN